MIKSQEKQELSQNLKRVINTHIYNIPWWRERQWRNLTVYFITVSLKKGSKMWEGTLFKIYAIRPVPCNNLSRRKHQKMVQQPYNQTSIHDHKQKTRHAGWRGEQLPWFKSIATGFSVLFFFFGFILLFAFVIWSNLFCFTNKTNQTKSNEVKQTF